MNNMYVDGLKTNNKKRMNKKERKQNKDFCRRYYEQYSNWNNKEYEEELDFESDIDYVTMNYNNL